METGEIGKIAEWEVKRRLGSQIVRETRKKNPYDFRLKDGTIVEVKGFKGTPVKTGFFYLTEAEKKILDGGTPYLLFLVYNIGTKRNNPDVIRLSREDIKQLPEKTELKYWYPINKKSFEKMKKKEANRDPKEKTREMVENKFLIK